MLLYFGEHGIVSEEFTNSLTKMHYIFTDSVYAIKIKTAIISVNIHCVAGSLLVISNIRLIVNHLKIGVFYLLVAAFLF